MKKILYGVLVAVCFTVLAVTAQASQRNFVWTIEYPTLGKGNAELEFYQTATTRDIQKRDASDWKQQIELEYGITDHLSAAIYQVYEQAADSPFMHYDGFKLELEYRIAEQNVLPVDILLYGEHEASTSDGNVFEGKLVLAKETESLSVAYNQVYKRELGSGDVEDEHEYTAGISYALAPWFRIGVESKGNYTEDEYAAGPTLAWMGNRIWANIGALYALNDETKDREVRFLLGVPF